VRHHCNHERLRDRLIEADRQWPVQVSVWLDLDRHELVPRHFGHRPEDAIVQRGLANLSERGESVSFIGRNFLASSSLRIVELLTPPSR